jgi:hypothetical protein
MGFLRSLFKKPPPQIEGEITFVSGPTGMVTTTDKQALTFNVAECVGFTPAERQVVKIERIEGMTARGLTWVAAPPAPDYDPEAKYASYQLTVLFDKALPSGAVELGQLLRDGVPGPIEVSSERAALEAPVDNLLVRMNGHSILAQQVHMPFPAAHMDLRQFSEAFAPGSAFIGITGPVIPLDRLRPTLGRGLPDPWAVHGVSRTIHQLALRLLDLGGRAVVLNRGGELVRSSEDFRRLSGDLADPQCVPFGAWLDYATTHQNKILRCWGMIAFGLVDLAVELGSPTDSPHFDEELSRGANAVHYAAMTSIRRNREFAVGEEVQVPESVKISAYGAQSESNTSVRYRIEDAGDEPYWLLRRV